MKKIPNQITYQDETEQVTRYLSSDVFRVRKVCPDFHHIKVGDIVVLISGVDKSKIPGYHFSEGFTTVCPVEKAIDSNPEYLGIKFQDLTLLSKPQLNKLGYEPFEK